MPGQKKIQVNKVIPPTWKRYSPYVREVFVDEQNCPPELGMGERR
jgi:hypothetical protein